MKKILLKLPHFDVVWCFEPNLYANLNWFTSKLKIYHPVDFISESNQLKLARSADVVFSVSHKILDNFKKYNIPYFFVNHGVASSFIKNEITPWVSGGRIKFAYIGSLCIPGLDRASLKKVITNNSQITFHFYGRINCQDCEHISFIDFIKKQKNVELYGVVSNQEMSVKLANYDGYLLCYNPSKELNSGTNSHKILEYLSFGKLLVANKVNIYQNYTHLIAMSKENDNADFYDVFKSALLRIEEWNKFDLIKERRRLAEDNTYSKQLDRIESILNSTIND